MEGCVYIWHLSDKFIIYVGSKHLNMLVFFLNLFSFHHSYVWIHWLSLRVKINGRSLQRTILVVWGVLLWEAIFCTLSHDKSLMTQTRHVVKLLLCFNGHRIFVPLWLSFVFIWQSLKHFEFLLRIWEIVVYLSSVTPVRHLTHLVNGLLGLIFATEWKIKHSMS